MRRLVPWATLAALTGCSLALNFDDECGTTADCKSGRVCESGYCVLGGGSRDAEVGGDAAVEPALVNDLCHTLTGATEDEVRAGDAILIGSLEPSTGALAATGRPVERAIYLAVDEINQLGGIDGRKLAVLACDDGTSENDVAERSATHLADVGKVAAIIGPAASGTVLEVFNAVAHDKKILLISPSATSPALTDQQDDDLIWRTPPSDDIQGKAIVEYLKDNDLTKVAVINRKDTYGDAFRKVIESGFCPNSVCSADTYFTQSYTENEQNLAAEQSRAMEGLVAFQPQVTVVIAYLDDGVSFLNLLGREAISHKVILTDGMKEPPVLERVEHRDILEGVFGTAPASPKTNPNYSIFARSYENTWRVEPGVFNAQAYDATYLLALAIGALGRDAVPTGPTLARQLKRMTGGSSVVRVGTDDFLHGLQLLRSDPAAKIDFDGASGPLDFNVRTGEAPADIEGWRLDLEANQIVSVGVIYTAAGEYRAPAMPSAPASDAQ